MTEVDDQLHVLGNDAGQIGKAFDARRGGASLLRSIGETNVVDRGDQVRLFVFK